MKTYSDIQGDGGSNVGAQVEAQRAAIAASLAEVRHVVAVGSGKGGVGKSTATMALAQVLRRRGQRVAILDADFNGPCQAQMAGLERAPWVPGTRGLGLPRRADGLGVVSFGSFLDHAAPATFESVSQGDEHVWRATKEFATLGQLLATIEWGALDVLLVDLPPGAERSVQFAEFLGPDAAFVIVTIPTDLARGVVARSITALRQSRARLVGYLENMAGYYHHAGGEVLPLFPAAATALDLPCLGTLPFDPRLAQLCDDGWPGDAVATIVEQLPGLDAAAQSLLNALEAK